ncbi:bifunctional hydroxymethylpyrimidine kinase/phosphomethylpyrimidine kinase [Methanocella sp. CWC-04]|uniref:Bifunctional hydroxymethylpyrimidine kinase/phosphomethylpyrimidine kinase n=1 Tax=Methanooceanicella nereidis TaxID=2052831 RepID=A0AAP2RCY9_9EURY|nr:bifunctional hydroxymethylpyrimidine kinase/phosphomethylpyrimidine kinase [Methanocella sp. CWC-04]MCD1294832.1 bifunctional hydroxymethylpyrimidine kinase/phosphomethylpyrimidine kinase [Methanocella sp. CWC-04]
MSHIVAMTIAGSDSGGGAGIQADLKTFQALGVHGTCAITAITSQNTLGVQGVYDVPAEVTESQIDSIMSDFNVIFAKTGMLSKAETVECVARKVKQYGLKVVIDPVMAAESGGRLLNPDAVDALKNKLIPLAEAVTPNTYEASVLCGFEIKDIDDAKKACEKIYALGVKNVIITGGHFGGIDILYNGDFKVFRGELVKGGTHGTGCTYAASLTAYLAKGEPVEKACEKAKAFVKDAVSNSMDVGHGVRPVNPGGKLF